jgi:hypothetical protein
VALEGFGAVAKAWASGNGLLLIGKLRKWTGAAGELIAGRRRLIAAADDPRPFAVIDAIVWIQAARGVICSVAYD